MKLTILLNPLAGRGRARARIRAALEFLRRQGVELQVRESRSPQHLVELARQAKEEKPELLVSAGGDGTHHYVLQALAGSALPLGLLPIGGGNDFASGLGIPLEPRAAAAVLLKGQVRQIDLARAGSAVYAGIAGVGFDSLVTRFHNEHVHWLQGSLPYAWSILRCLQFYRAQPLALRSDRQNFSGEVLFTVVGNNVSYGGGLKMTPRARLDDGLLDVCIVPYMSKLEFLRWVPSVYRGGHLAHPGIIYFQARKVELSSSSRMELFGDGEFMQELPGTIEVVPRALRVLVPL